VLRLKNPFFTGAKAAEAEVAAGPAEGDVVAETAEGSSDTEEEPMKADDRVDSGISNS